MNGRSRILIISALAIVVCAAAGLAVWKAVDDPGQANAAGIRDVIQANQEELMAVEGVVGVDVGTRAGEPVIEVYVDDPSAPVSSDMPASIGGYAVVTRVGVGVADPGATAGSEPGSPGNGTTGAAGGGEPAAGSGEPVPIEPGAGSAVGTPDEPAGTTGLDLRGTVISVAVSDGTAGREVVGSLLVEGSKDSRALYDAASVTITKETKFFAQVDGSVAEVHPEIEDLKGRQIEAGFTGPVAESYPVQATAGWITIL